MQCEHPLATTFSLHPDHGIIETSLAVSALLSTPDGDGRGNTGEAGLSTRALSEYFLGLLALPALAPFAGELEPYLTQDSLEEICAEIGSRELIDGGGAIVVGVATKTLLEAFAETDPQKKALLNTKAAVLFFVSSVGLGLVAEQWVSAVTNLSNLLLRITDLVRSSSPSIAARLDTGTMARLGIAGAILTTGVNLPLGNLGSFHDEEILAHLNGMSGSEFISWLAGATDVNTWGVLKQTGSVLFSLVPLLDQHLTEEGQHKFPLVVFTMIACVILLSGWLGTGIAYSTLIALVGSLTPALVLSQRFRVFLLQLLDPGSRDSVARLLRRCSWLPQISTHAQKYALLESRIFPLSENERAPYRDISSDLMSCFEHLQRQQDTTIPPVEDGIEWCGEVIALLRDRGLPTSWLTALKSFLPPICSGGGVETEEGGGNKRISEYHFIQHLLASDLISIEEIAFTYFSRLRDEWRDETIGWGDITGEFFISQGAYQQGEVDTQDLLIQMGSCYGIRADTIHTLIHFFHIRMYQETDFCEDLAIPRHDDGFTEDQEWYAEWMSRYQDTDEGWEKYTWILSNQDDAIDEILMRDAPPDAEVIAYQLLSGKTLRMPARDRERMEGIFATGWSEIIWRNQEQYQKVENYSFYHCRGILWFLGSIGGDWVTSYDRIPYSALSDLAYGYLALYLHQTYTMDDEESLFLDLYQRMTDPEILLPKWERYTVSRFTTLSPLVSNILSYTNHLKERRGQVSRDGEILATTLWNIIDSNFGQYANTRMGTQDEKEEFYYLYAANDIGGMVDFCNRIYDREYKT